MSSQLEKFPKELILYIAELTIVNKNIDAFLKMRLLSKAIKEDVDQINICLCGSKIEKTIDIWNSSSNLGLNLKLPFFVKGINFQSKVKLNSQIIDRLNENPQIQEIGFNFGIDHCEESNLSKLMTNKLRFVNPHPKKTEFKLDLGQNVHNLTIVGYTWSESILNMSSLIDLTILDLTMNSREIETLACLPLLKNLKIYADCKKKSSRIDDALKFYSIDFKEFESLETLHIYYRCVLGLSIPDTVKKVVFLSCGVGIRLMTNLETSKLESVVFHTFSYLNPSMSIVPENVVIYKLQRSFCVYDALNYEPEEGPEENYKKFLFKHINQIPI